MHRKVKSKQHFAITYTKSVEVFKAILKLVSVKARVQALQS